MRISALASVSYASGVPSLAWGSSAFSRTVGDTGTGVATLNLQGDRGIPTASRIALYSPRDVLAASELRSFGTRALSATTHEITHLQEGGSGAASAAADPADGQGFDVVFLSADGPEDGMIVGCGSIAFNAGTPSHLWQSGLLQAAIVDTGAGDISVDLVSDRNFDPTEIIFLATPRIAASASNMRAIGIDHTSDQRKQFRLLQEGSTGAASALTDFAFDWVAIARKRGDLVAGAHGGPKLWAAGRVTNGGAAAFAAQSSRCASVVRAGAGDVDLTLGAGDGVAEDECAIIVCPYAQIGASEMVSAGVVHTSNTEKQITTAQEAAMGGASTMADIDFAFLIAKAA